MPRAISKYATQVSGLTGDARKKELKRLYEIGRVRTRKRGRKTAKAAQELLGQEPDYDARVVDFETKCIQNSSGSEPAVPLLGGAECEQCRQLQEQCRQLKEQCGQLQEQCGQLREQCGQLQEEKGALRWERDRFASQVNWHMNLRDWVANCGQECCYSHGFKKPSPIMGPNVWLHGHGRGQCLVLRPLFLLAKFSTMRCCTSQFGDANCNRQACTKKRATGNKQLLNIEIIPYPCAIFRWCCLLSS